MISPQASSESSSRGAIYKIRFEGAHSTKFTHTNSKRIQLELIAYHSSTVIIAIFLQLQLLLLW